MKVKKSRNIYGLFVVIESKLLFVLNSEWPHLTAFVHPPLQKKQKNKKNRTTDMQIDATEQLGFLIRFTVSIYMNECVLNNNQSINLPYFPGFTSSVGDYNKFDLMKIFK